MTRGTIDELVSPNPLERTLPGLFQGDDFTCRFVSAFDTVIAPVFNTLDNMAAYLDPGTAPEDFLDWLAGWFGLELDATWAIDRRRAAVRDIVELYRWRGTTKGLRTQLQLQLGPDTEVEIDEGGGVTWSPAPGSDLPGSASDEVVVRVRVEDAAAVDVPRVEAMVRSVAPAHLVTRVEVAALTTRPSSTKARGKHREPAQEARSDEGEPPAAGSDPAAEDPS